MMGVNSLPKTVTRKRRNCGLNPGPAAPESSTLSTQLPSHPHTAYMCIFNGHFNDQRESPLPRVSAAKFS